MKSRAPKLLAWALLGSAFSATAVPAQGPSQPARATDQPISFKAPVRLMAGEKPIGDKRLFPSPVWHDVDGDGLADIVVGDLKGKLTVALRIKGRKPAAYAAEKPLTDSAGKEIDFHNW